MKIGIFSDLNVLGGGIFQQTMGYIDSVDKAFRGKIKTVLIVNSSKNFNFLKSQNIKHLYFNKKRVNFPRSPWPRSQDLEPLVTLPFAISIIKRTDLVKWGSLVGSKPYFFFLFIFHFPLSGSTKKKYLVVLVFHFCQKAENDSGNTGDIGDFRILGNVFS